MGPPGSDGFRGETGDDGPAGIPGETGIPVSICFFHIPTNARGMQTLTHSVFLTQ